MSELAERYAPSPAWFIRVVSEVLELGGDHVEPGLVTSLTKLIAEQDEELHRQVWSWSRDIINMTLHVRVCYCNVVIRATTSMRLAHQDLSKIKKISVYQQVVHI